MDWADSQHCPHVGGAFCLGRGLKRDARLAGGNIRGMPGTGAMLFLFLLAAPKGPVSG